MSRNLTCCFLGELQDERIELRQCHKLLRSGRSRGRCLQGRIRLNFPAARCLEHRLPHIRQKGNHACVYQVHGTLRLALRRGVETK
jgi:hypothetical protein